ncbi:CRISPR-associated Cse3 family protein [Leucobacter luti]|uniref:CRISPR-associated Cse3 family protein n=1 Tax=Leucobacter luti TaxID=340320 RepID=A0A4R6S0U2_9MICO|nr:type I-E CRISPR-associated protein Cas6/Cse3/CasE [Leucobacter luti]TDP92577.1 CRISPR-associated Cse3 family protein [Leucobacter luti]
MFLTRFQINVPRRGAQKLLASPHTMHAAVLASFPGTTTDRVLWRVDSRQHGQSLLILSPKEPDLTHLVEQSGWPTTETWETRSYSGILDRLAQEQQWAFRLRANPVHSLPPEPGAKRGKRVAHVTPEQQSEWLLRQAEKSGFGLGNVAGPTFAVTESQTITFSRQGKQVTLGIASFEGTLRVTDPTLLRQAMVAGIGPAKGYGCGLLTLAPVSHGG